METEALHCVYITSFSLVDLSINMNQTIEQPAKHSKFYHAKIVSRVERKHFDYMIISYYHSTTKGPGRPESMHIVTDSNVCYQHVQSDTGLPVPDRNTTNSEVYEEIVVTDDEHYVYSAPYL